MKKLSSLQASTLATSVADRISKKLKNKFSTFINKQSEFSKAEKLINELEKLDNRKDDINTELEILRSTLENKLKKTGFKGYFYWNRTDKDNIFRISPNISHHEIQTKIILSTISEHGDINEIINGLVDEMGK